MSKIDMSDYHRAAKGYWFTLVLTGGALCVWAAVSLCLSLTPLPAFQFFALLGCVAIFGALPVRIPGTTASITVADTFIFLAVILLGPPAAVLLGAADAFIGTIRSMRRATAWLAAPAAMALSIFLSAHIFYFTLAQTAGSPVGHAIGLAPINIELLIVPLTTLALAQYLLNTVLVASLYALKRRCSLWKLWRDDYMWTALTFFAAAVACHLLYAAMQSIGLLQVLLSLSVVGATFATYKIYFERIAEKTREAEQMARLHLATVEALATAIDAKDQATHYHVQRVQIYATGMGHALNLPVDEIEALRAGAMLHDIGKLAVPDHILNKPCRLTPAEFERTKLHTIVGAQILEKIDFPESVIAIVRHHHEWWDGTGYPDGLQGKNIPQPARIFAVIDCFDSVRDERSFRRGLTRAEAIALLQHGAGTHFDPQVVELFLRRLSKFEAEIAAQGLDHYDVDAQVCGPSALEANPPGALTTQRRRQQMPAYLDQIKNAHREVYALYEIASTFGSSLDIVPHAEALVEKIGRLIPFDTCALYLYDELQGYAKVVHVAGVHAELLREHRVAPGEGMIGFVLANRQPVGEFDPMLDFRNVALPVDAPKYTAMLALPLVKGEQLLGALAVYSLELERYTEDHRRLLDAVAMLASDAFANALHHAEAEWNALTDPLTGLPNARSLALRFDEEEARARRTGSTFCIVMLDLDDFKQVNDTFGHSAGDQLLREIARLLQDQLREYDFLARYAGDEFVAIVHELSAEQIDDLRCRIEQTVERFSLRLAPDAIARVGISAGAARYGTDGETLSHLLIAADQAMYNVKSEHHRRRRPVPPNETPVNPIASSAVN